MNPWLEVAGRFHVVLLHVPIGMMAGLALVEFWSALQRVERAPALLRVFAVLTALGAVLSAGSGYLLGRERPESATLTLHLWLGLAVAALAVLTAALSFAGGHWRRRLAMLAMLAVLGPAAHFGGTMTHGENFLFEPLRGRSAEADGEPGVYEARIAPILSAYCSSCHGATRSRGGLSLHAPEALLTGGESGAVIVAGDPGASELVRRMRLALDHDEHMPPKERRQPKEEQIREIEAWIAAGARMGRGPTLTGTPRQVEERAGADDAAARAPSAAVAALRERLVHVEEIEPGLLAVDFAAVARDVGDEEAARWLAEVAEHVGSLSLARTRITDAALAAAAGMTRLRNLDLRGTAVTSAGVAALSGHGGVRTLILARTNLDDGAVESLARMTSLERVYLWESGVTAAGVAELSRLRPGLLIDAGADVGGELEREGEVRLSSDAPPPEGERGVAALTPINSLCPVSGAAVDPRYAVVHAGRVVGFCCPDCAREFWTDPARFAERLGPIR